jgi:hypothetical protein
MQRFIVTVVVVLACGLLVACGGSKKKSQGQANAAGGAQGQVQVDLTPMQELQALSTNLQAGVDALMSPINETQLLIDHITAMPARLGIDARSLMGMCSATLQSGQVAFDASISPDAAIQAEVQGVVARLAFIVAGLKAIPENVKALGQQAVEATAKVPVLATQVTTSANVTLANPFAKGPEKAQAQADINAVTQVQGEVQAKISEVQNTIMGIPAMATSALAKFAAAFAVG